MDQVDQVVRLGHFVQLDRYPPEDDVVEGHLDELSQRKDQQADPRWQLIDEGYF